MAIERRIVSLKINGKVAEKDRDGRPTGRMISLSEGDIGAVVKEVDHRGDGRAYMLALTQGHVVLRGNAFNWIRGHEREIPHSSMVKAHPDYDVGEVPDPEEVEY